MIEQQTFFKKYHINQEDFESANISWKMLSAIYDDYLTIRDNLESTGNDIAARLRKLDTVHSLRIRIKDPEHLIEKIIRKKCEDNNLKITLNNYRDKITDLIGVRALHLFKEDWGLIHDFIEENWEFQEEPTANVRKGDSDKFINKFKEKGCKINEHKFGYRSVHYIVKSSPTKQMHLTEIQVRTIFEEGFSEIDHQIRYPYHQDNIILANYLAIFNRLAGSADEMGSFVKILKGELDENDQKIEQLLNEKEKLTGTLKSSLAKLEIAQEEKDTYQRDLDQLSSIKSDILGSTASLPISVISRSLDLTSFDFFDKDLLFKPSESYATVRLSEGPNLLKPKISKTESKNPERKSKTKKKKGKAKPKK